MVHNTRRRSSRLLLHWTQCHGQCRNAWGCGRRDAGCYFTAGQMWCYYRSSWFVGHGGDSWQWQWTSTQEHPNTNGNSVLHVISNTDCSLEIRPTLAFILSMVVAGHEGLSRVFVLVQITSWCLVCLCGFGGIGLLVFVWLLFCCVWATVFSVWLGIVAWRIWRWWICMQQQYVKVVVSLHIIRMHSNWRKMPLKSKIIMNYEKKTQRLKCYLAKPKLLSRPTLVRFNLGSWLGIRPVWSRWPRAGGGSPFGCRPRVWLAIFS